MRLIARFATKFIIVSPLAVTGVARKAFCRGVVANAKMKEIMNTKPLVRFALGFIASLVALSASAQLQYYWDATNPITNSPGSGGTGNWSTSTADWWVSGSADSVWANNNIANFAGTAGTVTLTGAVTANGLTFTTSGYTVAGS